MSVFEIQLRDVMFQACHGVLPEERVCGNQYRVNVSLRIDADGYDEESDSISATISYADVFDILNGIMSIPVRLLETIAVKFAKEVRRRWPQIESGEIEIVKIAPPIPAFVGQAAVKYIF